ncbi:trissin receptor-like [Gigantopelta aegis]|uniref:trissin receptor-like n=1 Tax=Gigantopelta aegis TaxID=1735272 RepID=UPI001B8881A7|nr:trissin receptor-like [Gigantopelta aegis]
MPFLLSGNLVVLLVIIKNKRMRTRTNFFLANLAVADFAVGIFCVIPNLFSFLTLRWILGNYMFTICFPYLQAMCRIYYFVQSMSYTASVLFLVVIAVERYVAIMQPLRTRQLFTTLRLQVAQVCIWVLASGYNVPVFYIFDTSDIPTPEGVKSYCYPTVSTETMRIFVTTNFVVWYLVPLAVLMYVYSRIAVTLWSSTKNIQTHDGVLSDKNSSSSCCCCCCCCCSKFHDRRGSGEADEKYTVHTALTNESSSSGNNADAGRKSNGRVDHENDMSRSETNLNATRNSSLGVRYCIPNNSRLSISSASAWSRNARLAHGEAGSAEELASVMCSEAMYSENSCSFRSRIAVRPPRQANLSSRRAVDSRRHVIKLLIAVLFSFAVCVLPNHLRLLMSYWSLFPTIKLSIFPPVSFLMLFVNSALNPVLYWLFSGSFRQSFLDTFTCSCRKKANDLGRYTVT